MFARQQLCAAWGCLCLVESICFTRMALPRGTKRERVIVMYLCNYRSNYTSMETWARAWGLERVGE